MPAFSAKRSFSERLSGEIGAKILEPLLTIRNSYPLLGFNTRAIKQVAERAERQYR
jgi:hypothetical protein